MLGGGPRPPLLGTRVHYYRCSLPGLAGFAMYRCEVTDASHHNMTTLPRRTQRTSKAQEFSTSQADWVSVSATYP